MQLSVANEGDYKVDIRECEKQKNFGSRYQDKSLLLSKNALGS